MRSVRLVAIGACVVASLPLLRGEQRAEAGGALEMAAFFESKWPSRPAWSPDGRFVSFLWTDWRGQELYAAERSGGAPIQLTRTGDYVGGSTWNSAGTFGAWSPDGRRLVYSHDGDLFVVTVPDGATTRLTETADDEDGARFAPDGVRIAFTKGGNLFVLHTTTGQLRQLTRDGRVGGPTWSPDGRWLAVSVSDPPVRLNASPPYVGPLITFHGAQASGRDAAIVEADGGALRRVEASPELESIVGWSPDGARFLIERVSVDAKDRTLFVCETAGAACRSFFQQRDEKYLPSNDQMAAFSPDGQSILFTSDRSGWNHLYLVLVAGGAPRQLTNGRFEVSFASWGQRGERIFFASTEAGPAERHLHALEVATGSIRRLTRDPGVNATLVVSPTRDELAFIHADPSHLPDLWMMDAAAASPARQVTESMTEALRSYHWRAPQIVSYPGADDLPIAAQLFTPRSFVKGQRYAAIVHVHQAAIYQEAYLGPGPQKDNTTWYGWHQRLADLGYVVLNVDFRGSYGYGRDFRTGNHLAVGVGDAADVIRGVDYLKTLGYVDANRLGVYGMSYGGHMVLSLLTKYPDVFKAGINIAGVYDYQIELGPWATRNPWMQARLGPPEKNPEAYRNASAANFIDALRAPVMTLQGTNDTNVTILQSIRLIDELLQRGRTFEFELYPGEVHFFGRRNSWLDAFGKMETFFDRYVRSAGRTPIRSSGDP